MAKTAIYSDVDGNLTRGTDGDIKRQTEIDAVKNSLGNITTTFQRSRRMLQDFATPIHEMLFEPIDDETAYIIAERILEAIEFWDPRVTVNNIRIIPMYDDNEYRCSLNFSIAAQRTEEATLDFVLKAQ